MSELSTPLERAVRREDISAVNLRFQQGDTPQDLNHSGIPVLFDALKTNNIALLQCLQQHRANFNQPYNHNGYTPLIYACLYCELPTITWLIQQGQAVQQRTAMGIGAMHVAVQRGNLPIVEFLYQQGADIFTPSPSGELPLLLSLKAKNGLPVFKFLLGCYAARQQAIQPLVLPTLAIIFEKQPAHADAAIRALLPFMQSIPSEAEIRKYMALPGNYASSPLRSLQMTLGTRLSASLFALLKAQRISRKVMDKEKVKGKGSNKASVKTVPPEYWQGPEGL